MNILLTFVFLIGGFSQKWYVDHGSFSSYGRITVADTDHDSRPELIFGTYDSILRDRTVIYELDQGDTFAFQVVVDSSSGDIWAAGDFDNDSKSDLVLTGHFGLPVVGPQIYESMNYFAYPTIEVWRDTVGQAVVEPTSVYDIDQDGVPEFVTNKGDPPNWLWIYESVGDNQYDTVFTTNPDTANLDSPSSTHAFGDFDLDGRIEFAMGGMSAGPLGATYWVYESSANNKYKRVLQSYLPTKNIKDCFSVADADSDGKPEFVIKGCTVPDNKFRVFIFESTGDNSYAIVDTFHFSGFGGGYYGGYSASGDVDGDGLPEIALEGSFRVYMIEADANDNFYVFDTLPGNGSGSQVAICDIDGNGFSEVIISGNNETRIYEYISPGIEAEEKTEYSNRMISISPNPFSNRVSIELCVKENLEDISLSILDVSGRLVKDFQLSTSESADTRTISWDGSDEASTRLPAGVYFLKVETSEYNITRKLLKIK